MIISSFPVRLIILLEAVKSLYCILSWSLVDFKSSRSDLVTSISSAGFENPSLSFNPLASLSFISNIIIDPSLPAEIKN